MSVYLCVDHFAFFRDFSWYVEEPTSKPHLLGATRINSADKFVNQSNSRCPTELYGYFPTSKFAHSPKETSSSSL